MVTAWRWTSLDAALSAIHSGTLTPWPTAGLTVPGSLGYRRPPSRISSAKLAVLQTFSRLCVNSFCSWQLPVWCEKYCSSHHPAFPLKRCKKSNTLQPFCNSQRGQLEGGARFTGVTLGDGLDALCFSSKPPTEHWERAPKQWLDGNTLCPLWGLGKGSQTRKGVRLCRSLIGLINTAGLQGKGINTFWRNKIGFLLRNGLSEKK